MPIFDYRFNVAATLDEVSRFHGDTRALKRLTPPPVIIQLHDIEPLGEGSTSRFTLWVGPIPLRWTAVHRNVSNSQFTDVQASGPVQKWEHTHTFSAISDDETQVSEHIEFEHFPGWRGWFSRLMFCRPSLWGLFTYRKMMTRHHIRRDRKKNGQVAQD